MGVGCVARTWRKNSSPFLGLATAKYFTKSFCLIDLMAFLLAVCMTPQTAAAVLSFSGVDRLYSSTASSEARAISAYKKENMSTYKMCPKNAHEIKGGHEYVPGRGRR